jgi:hypothetical protein
MPVDHRSDDVGHGQETVVEHTPVEVRRRSSLSALVGAGSSAVAIAYLWRASQTGTPLDWLLCGVMAAIAVFYLSSLLDSRTPLLVADDLGVRIRLGDEWRGLPWEAIDQVVVQPRRGLLRDGRVSLTPHNPARALEGLDVKGRRHAALNRTMYGATLAVPLGLTTRVSTCGELTLAQEIAALALGRTDVVEVPGPEQPSAVAETATDSAEDRAAPEASAAPETPAGPDTPLVEVEAPVEPDEPRAYLETVCLGPHLERLAPGEHEGFLDAVLRRLGERPVLDYVRLNIVATRGRE